MGIRRRTGASASLNRGSERGQDLAEAGTRAEELGRDEKGQGQPRHAGQRAAARVHRGVAGERYAPAELGPEPGGPWPVGVAA